MSAGSRALLLAILVTAGAGPIGPRAAAAQDPAPTAKPWFEEITVNGFASTSYSYNFNVPPAHTNAFRVFDVDDNTFEVDGVELVAQHAALKPREGGFRVDVAMGGSIPRISAARGLFRDPVTGVAQDVDLQQAFASYVVPVGTGLQVSAGKFVTHLGAEVIDGYDGWNWNATGSFLFGFAIPFTHTGVRASMGFGPRLSAMAMVANGWDNARDNNTAKTGGAQLVFTPVPAFTLTLNSLVGAERDGNDADLRRIGDVVALYALTPRLSIMMNADLAEEDGVLAPARERAAQWSGVAGYVRWQACSTLALNLRGETFQDRDGVRTGTAQRLDEVTLTPELRVTPHFLLRGDLRFDRSDRRVFPTDTGIRDSQTTVLVNAIAAF